MEFNKRHKPSPTATAPASATTESNTTINDNTVNETDTDTDTAAETDIEEEYFELPQCEEMIAADPDPIESVPTGPIQDCIYSLKCCKCDPTVLKSMLVDLLYTVIESAELIDLEELINNNIIKSGIISNAIYSGIELQSMNIDNNNNNNNPIIKSKLFNSITISAANSDCKYNVKSSKYDPTVLKSIYTDILNSAIKSVELTELDELFNNNIIQSMINNNTLIQYKLPKFNQITQEQNELYRSKYTHFSLMDNNSLSLILQYLPFKKICIIKSINKLINLVSNSNILLNQLIINYNPSTNNPNININISNIRSISMNLVSHLQFNLTLANLSNINILSKFTQLKSIQLYQLQGDSSMNINKLELNFINQLLLLQHISISLDLGYKSNSISFDDIAIMLANINSNRTNINGKLLSIELEYRSGFSIIIGSLLSDKGLISICNNCPELKYLKLFNTIITDSGLIHLKQLNSLEKLSIIRSGSITDSGLSVLLKLGNSLTELEFNINWKLTNTYLSIIAQLQKLKLFKFDLKDDSWSKSLNELSSADGLKLLSKSKSIETIIIDSRDWFTNDLGENLINLSTLRNLSIITRNPINENAIESLSKLIQLTGLELNVRPQSKSDSDYKLLNKLSKLTNLKSLVLNINYSFLNIETNFESNPELYSMIELIDRIPSLLYFAIPDSYLDQITIAREYNRKWSKLLYKQRPTLYYDTNHPNNGLLQKPLKCFNSLT